MKSDKRFADAEKSVMGPCDMNVKMQGLDVDKVYTVKEINLMPGKESDLECNGKQYRVFLLPRC